MKFELKDPTSQEPDEQKKISLIETPTTKVIGEITLEELQKALAHHKDIKAQSETAIIDLEGQITEVQKLFKK